MKDKPKISVHATATERSVESSESSRLTFSEVKDAVQEWMSSCDSM